MTDISPLKIYIQQFGIKYLGNMKRNTIEYFYLLWGRIKTIPMEYLLQKTTSQVEECLHGIKLHMCYTANDAMYVDHSSH